MKKVDDYKWEKEKEPEKEVRDLDTVRIEIENTELGIKKNQDQIVFMQAHLKALKEEEAQAVEAGYKSKKEEQEKLEKEREAREKAEREEKVEEETEEEATEETTEETTEEEAETGGVLDTKVKVSL